MWWGAGSGLSEGRVGRRLFAFLCGLRSNVDLTFDIGFWFGFGVDFFEYVFDALNGLDADEEMSIDEQHAREREKIHDTFAERTEH